MSFILAEEILWAGDHKTTDKLKSRITADTFQIERKNGGIRQIPNRLHLLMTTNHDHAVAAGVRDRRNVVYDISDEKVGDKGWFDRLYRDLDDGGTSEFLYFLQNLRLGDWHPREILKTAETTEQQRMSADSVSQWSRACIDAHAIIGQTVRGFSHSHELGQRIASEDLREAYSGYCKQQGLRSVNIEVFGKACVEMFGPRKRLSAAPVGRAVLTVEDVGVPDEADKILNQRIADLKGPRAEPDLAPCEKRRPWGYEVPDGDTWKEKIDARLGLQH